MLLACLSIPVSACRAPQTFPATYWYPVPGTKSDVVAYRDFGDRNAPLTLLMIHGAGVSKASWSEVEARFREKYRTICIDLPGHGESTLRLSDLPMRRVNCPPSGRYTMASQAAFLRKFIADLDLGKSGDLVLVGSSRGGGVALETYHGMSAAERARIKGLFLIAPAAHACRKPEFYDEGETAAFVLRLPFWALVAAASATKETMKDILYAFYPDKDMADHRLADEWAAAILPMYRRLGAAYFAVRMNLDTWDELVCRDKTDPADRQRYADVACPVFLAWGDRDNVVDISIMLILKEALRDCDARVIPGAGHDLLGLKDKRVLDWMTEFLARNQSPAASAH